MTAQPQRRPILVVDDELHILHVVSLKLSNAGYDVLTAQDGEEGYELAVQSNPAIIISDYQMPFVSGLELAMKLHKLPETASTPILMLTAWGFALNDDDIAQTNIVSVLSKPFSPREVLEQVEQLMAQQEPAHT